MFNIKFIGFRFKGQNLFSATLHIVETGHWERTLSNLTLLPVLSNWGYVSPCRIHFVPWTMFCFWHGEPLAIHGSMLKGKVQYPTVTNHYWCFWNLIGRVNHTWYIISAVCIALLKKTDGSIDDLIVLTFSRKYVRKGRFTFQKQNLLVLKHFTMPSVPMTEICISCRPVM